MKLTSIVLTVALAFTGFVQAQEINHPDVNPDVLMDLFVGSTMVKCNAGVCQDAITHKPHTYTDDRDGFFIVFNDTTEVPDSEMDVYRPLLLSLYSELMAEQSNPFANRL